MSKEVRVSREVQLELSLYAAKIREAQAQLDGLLRLLEERHGKLLSVNADSGILVIESKE